MLKIYHEERSKAPILSGLEALVILLHTSYVCGLPFSHTRFFTCILRLVHDDAVSYAEHRPCDMFQRFMNDELPKYLVCLNLFHRYRNCKFQFSHCFHSVPRIAISVRDLVHMLCKILTLHSFFCVMQASAWFSVFFNATPSASCSRSHSGIHYFDSSCSFHLTPLKKKNQSRMGGN